MTTIQQIKDWPLGYRGGGFVVTVKTAKKIWKVGQCWFQQACIMDEAGEMLADFKLGKQRIPIQRASEYNVIICEVQAEEKQGKKLFVSQFKAVTQTVEEFEQEMQFLADKEKHIIEGKCRTILIAAVERRKDADNEDYERLDRHLEWIMK